MVVFLVLALGFIIFYPDDKPYEPPIREVPLECQEFKDDVCALFDCMVDQCWCDDFSDPVLPAAETEISNEEEAIAFIEQYLESSNSEYNDVRSANALNDVFFNVFAYNVMDDEKVFTVRADGTIILTVCGI